MNNEIIEAIAAADKMNENAIVIALATANDIVIEGVRFVRNTNDTICFNVVIDGVELPYVVNDFGAAELIEERR
jgi:hypothetical protein